MLDVDVKSPQYYEDKTNYYIMSIQAMPDGLSFCIRDYLSNTFVRLVSLSNKSELDISNLYEHALAKYPEFSRVYRKVIVCCASTPYTLVPDALVDKDKLTVLFEMQNGKVENSAYCSFQHFDLNATSIFSIDTTFHHLLKQNHDGAVFMHSQDIAIWSGQLLPNNVEEQVQIDVNDTFFTLTAFSMQKLIFHNSFAYQTVDDLLFYFLNVIKQVEFDNRTLHLYCSGVGIEKNSELVSGLEKFIQHVSFQDFVSAFNYTEELYTIPSHHFNHLYLAHQCE